VEYFVSIDVRLPRDFDESRKAELVRAEGQRAKELADRDVIRRLWRIPGRWSNIGIWNASDATELHDAIASLPLFPWLEVTVTPLARHPSDPLCQDDPTA
jgi:muconolactone D-isomerase